MSKWTAQRKAEEKKKSSASSASTPYEKAKQVYQQEQRQAIADANAAARSVGGAQTSEEAVNRLNAYRAKLAQLQNNYGYDVSDPVKAIDREVYIAQNSPRWYDMTARGIAQTTPAWGGKGGKVGKEPQGRGGRVTPLSAKAYQLKQNTLTSVQFGADTDAGMTYGIYDPTAAERTRIGNVLAAGGKGWTSGQASALGFLLDPTDDGSMTDAEMMFGNAADDLGNNRVAQWLNEKRAKATKALYGSADALNAEAAESERLAKKGLGGFGRTLVDMGITGSQMALDAAFGRVTGLGMSSMASRTFGQSAREALANGATQQQAFNYGMNAALVEVGTEKMFDVLKIFGGGAADEALEQAIRKMAKTDLGRTALRVAGGFGGEALEELASGIINPLIRSEYDKNALKDYKDLGYWSDTFYEALVGGLLGAVGGGGQIVTGQNAAANQRLRMQDMLDAAKGEAVNRYAARFGTAAPAVQTVYNMNKKTAVEDFQRGFEAAYYMGREGVAVEEAVNAPSTSALTENQRRSAWEIGRDAKANGVEPVKLETMEGGTGNGTAMDLRRGGERNPVQNPGGEVREVESRAGSEAEGPRIADNAKDADAQSVKTRREAVSIPGMREQDLLVPEEKSYTPEMKKAMKNAAKDGVQLHFFMGDYLKRYMPDGSVRYSRGVSDSNGNMWVRADDPNYTASQIARHEGGHDLIARGVIDLDDAQEKIVQTLGEEAYRQALDDYRDAYDGADMTDEEVFEEIVCDARGGMNIFEGAGVRYDEAAKRIVPVQQAAREGIRERSGKETRGPPAEVSAETEADAEALGMAYDPETESFAPDDLKMSRLTWEQSEYVQARDETAERMAQELGIDVDKAKAYIDDVNSVAKMIADEKGRLDYEDTGLSPFVSNSEYGGSFDMTTLCKKRRLITGTFSAIQNALKNTALTAGEILEIRKMMDDAGLEVSCGKCYVEGSRANMGKFTKEFLRLYEKYYPNRYVPNMAEMNTPDGIEWVRQNYLHAYEKYEQFWNNHGKLREGDPNLFASQQKPKLYQMRSAYKGEVLKYFKGDAKVKEKNDNGGVRVQSFSDFEIVHLIDMMQIITDLSRVGLNSQAYTKVPDFAWAFGNTGMKINLSIDAWDVGEDGKLIFNNKEGMPFEEAMKLRDAYSENVGTICCVYDDRQLLAALADPRIDFIIPFHRSQWKKAQYKAMGLPPTTKDYTYQQNEKWLKPAEHTHEWRGKQVKTKCTNYMPNMWWDENLDGKGNAEKYLQMCARDGKRPKFYKFLVNNGDGSYSLQPDGSTDGYWKLLIDFKMYDNDGNYAPQKPVRPDFNMGEIDRMLKSYEGGHNRFPVAQGIVDEFVSKYKAEHKGQKFSDVVAKQDAERFNDKKTDIRFSRDLATEQLARENRALEREVDTLTKQVQRWKRETKLTKRIELREGDVTKTAKAMIDGMDSTADVKNVAADMKYLAEYIFNGGRGDSADFSWTVAREMATDIAEKVVGAVRMNERADVEDLHNDILFYTRKGGKKVQVSENEIESICAGLGVKNLTEFNKTYGDYIQLTIADTVGNGIERVYSQLQEQYPGVFTEDYNQKAMVTDLVETLERTAPQIVTGEDAVRFYDEAVTWAANDVIDRVLDEGIRQMPQTFADRAKARLQRVREQGNERVERTKREYAERSRKAIERMQVRQEKQIADLKAKQKAKEQGARDRKNTRAVWHKIERLGIQFRQMAEKPSQAASKHAPIRLARALQGVAESFRFENRRMVPARLDKVFKELQVTYQAMEDKNDPNHIYYDEDLYSALVAVKTDVEGYATTGLTGIDQQQLQSIYDLLRWFEKTITSANQFISKNWAKGIIETGQEGIRQVIDAEPAAKKGIAARYLNYQLSPDRFFERIFGFGKGNIGAQIAKMFADGTEKMLRIQQDFYYTFEKFSTDKRFDDLTKRGKDHLVDVGLKDTNGNPILLTHDMMLGIYEHLLSEDNLMGAAYGGLDVPVFSKYYRGDVAESYEDGVRTMGIDTAVFDLYKQLRDLREQAQDLQQISEENAENIWEKREEVNRKIEEIESEIQAHEGEIIGTLLDVRANIEKKMSDFERELFTVGSAWMKKSADYINEETREMYGYEKANVEHYWPIHRNTDFVNVDLRTAKTEYNLENWKSLKERVKSNAPIKVTGFIFELDNHTKMMSTFCGYVAAQRDFDKLMKTRSYDSNTTLKEVIHKKFGGGDQKAGRSAQEYIDNFTKRISGAEEKEKPTYFSIVRRNLPRATLSGNIRVYVSQLASIPTAAAEVGWGNMIKGWARYSLKGFSANQQEQLAKSNPWFWQRARGEGGMREFAEMHESTFAFDRAYNKVAGTKVGKLFLNGCQRFDMYATYTQWAMAEEWAKQHGFKPGTEAFDQAVNDKYRDIIRKTQPNYTLTERSELLSDRREGMKWLTMYKTQSNQNMNILYESAARLRKYQSDYKAGKNGVTEQDLREARREFANSYTAVIIGGTVAFALFRTAANALIHAMNNYRDDDDEVTAKSFMDGIFKEIMSATSGMFLLGSQIYEIVYAVVKKEKYWGVSDSAIGALDDVVTKSVKVFQKIGTDDPPSRDDWVKLINSLMVPLGVPSKNLSQIVTGIVNHIEDIQNGEFLSFNAGLDRTATKEVNKIVDHYLDGAGDKVQRAWDELLKLKDGDEKKAQEAVRGGIKDAYLAGEITDKQALDLLKRYGGKDGDDAKKDYLLKWQCEKDTGIAYKDLRQAYLDDEITDKQAAEYLKKYGGMDAEKAKDSVTGWRAEKETGVALGDMKEAYLDGDITKAEVIRMKMKYDGKTQEEAEEYAQKLECEKDFGIEYGVKNVQEALVEGKLTETQARTIWTKYGGKDEDAVDDLVKAAQFVKAHPTVGIDNVTTTRINVYEKYAPKTMDAGKFMEYAAQIKKDQDAGKYPGIPDGKGGKKPYSVMDDVAAWIMTLPLKPEEKIAVFLTYTNGKTTSVNRYKWS